MTIAIWRFAMLLLITAALAFSGERNTIGSPAENVKESGPDCTRETRPKGKPAFGALGKVNPLRLLHRLDAAATDLTIRFSSWPAGRPAWQEMPSIPPASDPIGHWGDRPRACQADGELFMEKP